MKFFLSTVLALGILLAIPTLAHTQTPTQNAQEKFYQAVVTTISEDGVRDIGGYKNPYQNIIVQLSEGPQKDKRIPVEYGGMYSILATQKLKTGDTVIVDAYTANGKTSYSILDKYRLNKILFMLLGFFVLAILAAGKKGLGAIVGLLVSLLIILKFIVPQILAGNDPLFISIAGSLCIMFITTYLAHGISKQTTIALGGTFLSLCLTAILSYFFVQAAGISGVGNEDEFLLKFGMQQINLQGLLLGGIIIGSLGALNDITTTQSVTIFELAQLDKKLTFEQLVSKGLTIGKEHIASLVNTLVLAYAGTSLAIFIMIQVNPSGQPLWTIINSEVISQEIVRTIAGSMGLILAVPITTILAAFACKYKINFT